MQGIQSLGPGVADKMAAMGRFEDDQIAHVAEGEVIVPAPILKYYPEVKKQVFDAIKDQGLDPEQFIVGGEMVAINPNTGVQEFGFLSKAFKKIKKLVKKAAPLLIAAALPGIGTALGTGIFSAGGALGGAAGLMGTAAAADAAFKGGNLRDVLKAGATGAVVGGVSGAISKGIGSLTGPAPVDGVTPGLEGTTPGLDPAPAASTASNASTSTAATAGQKNADAILEGMARNQASTSQGVQVVDASGVTGTMTDAAQPNYFQQAVDPSTTLADIPNTADLGLPLPQTPTDFSGYSIDPSTTLADLPSTSNLGQSVPTGISLPGGGPRIGPTVEAAKAGSIGRADPTMFENFKASFKKDPLPSTANLVSLGSVGYGLLGGGGEDQQQVSGGVSGEELEKFLNEGNILNYQGRAALGMYYNPETREYQDVPYVPNSGIVTAAAGGHIVGPGTGTSDSIPAYLSDGEFVMTADAVKGAGGGDRKKGAAKMYAMMNKFEGQA